eukprot:1156825-Pelagomonas_calceolata.AAC.2
MVRFKPEVHGLALEVGGVGHTPHTLDPHKELGLETHKAIKVALKRNAHAQYTYKLASTRVLSRRLLPALITRLGVLLINLPIFIDLNLFFVPSVKGIHGDLTLGKEGSCDIAVPTRSS